MAYFTPSKVLSLILYILPYRLRISLHPIHMILIKTFFLKPLTLRGILADLIMPYPMQCLFHKTSLHLIPKSMLKYCNFEEYSICIFLWSPMFLLGEPLVLLCTPILLIRITNKSHEVVPSNCKGGSLAPQCGYLSLHV